MCSESIREPVAAASHGSRLAFGEKKRMILGDRKLQEHCERAAGLVFDCPPEQRPVLGVLDACDWFRLTEGEDAPRLAKAIGLPDVGQGTVAGDAIECLPGVGGHNVVRFSGFQGGRS